MGKLQVKIYQIKLLNIYQSPVLLAIYVIIRYTEPQCLNFSLYLL